MTASERTFEVSPGLHLAARVHGPDDGAPMLAMHGWLDNAATFDGLAPLLPGRRIVALDFAGTGCRGGASARRITSSTTSPTSPRSPTCSAGRRST
jgi:pimeloyl-ACP methyl ester carboxylesterase